LIQLCILKINGYGPWTLTLGSDREHELQILQAKLYGELQKIFSEKNCLVFQNRSDEFFAVSNGMNLNDFVEIQKQIRKLFSINLSISIGFGNTPFEANLKAYEGKKNKKFLDKENEIFGFLNNESQSEVTIMHFDVEDLTSRRNTLSPFEISEIIFELYYEMLKFFRKINSLTFFMGGDNFMVVCSEDAKKNAQSFIDIVKKDHGIILNCGIGHAKTSREAASFATKSLDTIREIRNSGKEKPEVYELKC
jgi:GTP cyclohydrolase IIa